MLSRVSCTRPVAIRFAVSATRRSISGVIGSTECSSPSLVGRPHSAMNACRKGGVKHGKAGGNAEYRCFQTQIVVGDNSSRVHFRAGARCGNHSAQWKAFRGELALAVLHFHTSSSSFACTATTLQQSITEPPPTAKISVTLFSRASVVPSCVLA